MRSVVFFALSALALFGAEILCLAPTAAAQTVEVLDEAEALAVDAKLYAEAYGVTQVEATRRLLIMHGTGEQVAQIEQEYGASLAGVYFDNGSQFDIKFKVTGDTAPPNRKIVRKATKAAGKQDRAARRAARKALRANFGVSDQQVEAAEDALAADTTVDAKFEPRARRKRGDRQQNVASKFSMLKQKIPQLEIAVDDEQTEETLVYVKDDDGSVKAAAETALGVPVRVIVIPSGVKQTAVRGGSLLNRMSDDGLHCMTAFAAKRVSTGALGVLTAGHCLNGTALKYVDADGTRINNIAPVSGMSQNNSTMDIGFLANTTAIAEFYADTTTTPRSLTTSRSRASTTAKAGTVKGSFICHLGQTSPTNAILIQSCGEVTSTNGAGANGGTTFVVVSNTQSGAGTILTSGQGTLRCVRGDSGGPVFATTTAYGVQSACAWNDAAETIASILVYTSIDYAASIGAALVFK